MAIILDCFSIILYIINEFINNYRTIIILKQVCRLFYNHKFDVEYDGPGHNLLKIKGVNVISIVLDPLYNYNDILYMYKLTKITENNMYFNGRCLRQLTSLTSLTTESFTITDYGIETLTKLTYLNMWYNKNITDSSVKKLTNLTYLDIGGSNKNITDSSIKYLTNLTYLNCESLNNVTDVGISYLTSLTHLVCNVNITDRGIINLKKLTHLDCSFCNNITDNGLNGLHLIELNCSDNQEITDDSIKNMLTLKYLTCCNTKITNESIKYLSNLIYLRRD